MSFKSTNLIESLMTPLEARNGRVTRWRTSDQKLRWCASALSSLERQFCRVKPSPALHRLARKRFVMSEWGTSANKRRARYYSITAAGRALLHSRSLIWQRYAEDIGRALRATEDPA